MYKHWPSSKVEQPSQSFLFVVNCSPSFVRKYRKSWLILVPRASWGFLGSGDTGFEVLDFRTSGHFWFKSNLEGCLFKALNQLNFQSLTLRQEQVNTFRNVVENQKSAEVLKFQLSWNYNWVFSVIFCDTWSYKKRFYQRGEKRWSLVILDNEGTASAPVARDHFLGDIWVSREIKSHGKRQIQVESFSEWKISR